MSHRSSAVNRMCVVGDLDRLRQNFNTSNHDSRNRDSRNSRDSRDSRDSHDNRNHGSRNEVQREHKRNREIEEKDNNESGRSSKRDRKDDPVFIELHAFCKHYRTPNGKGGYNPPRPEAIQKLIIQFQSRKQLEAEMAQNYVNCCNLFPSCTGHDGWSFDCFVENITKILHDAR